MLKLAKFPIGADVEFFFKEGDRIIESARVISPEGFSIVNGKVTCDGVQGEINPRPDTCRMLLCDNIHTIIKHIYRKGTPVFSSNINLNDEEFENISPESKEFGCNPSYNIYVGDEPYSTHIKGSETRQRTCGGHIHLGASDVKMYCKCSDSKNCNKYCSYRNNTFFWLEYLNKIGISIHHDIEKDKDIIAEELLKYLSKNTASLHSSCVEKITVSFSFGNIAKVLTNPKLTIPLLDIFVGIPSVLVDRDPHAKTRRLMYGKAGEYRKTKYGLEYRTLSNFWIKSRHMTSLFTGLARQAVLFAAESLNDDSELKKLYSLVDPKDVAKIINENDFNAAKEVFLKIQDVFTDNVDYSCITNFPLTKYSIGSFKSMIMSNYKDGDNVYENWDDDCHIETWLGSFYYDSTTKKKFEEYKV